MTPQEAREAIKEAYGNSEYTDEIIKALEQEPKTWSLDNAREDFMHDVYNTLDFLPTNNEANRIIDSFDRITSSITPKARWIPVSERLPKVGQRVLVADKCEAITTALYFGKSPFWREMVVAWMPLPQPYKESEEEE